MVGNNEPIDERGARRLTWNKAQVCDALGISEATFALKRGELAKAGFPDRIPGLNAWSIAAVTDWVRHSGGEYVPYIERGATVSIVSGDPLEAMSGELEHRYAGPSGPMFSATGRSEQ